jgi:hypothetical protein
MEIEIEDERPVDLFLVDEPFDGNGDIIEITEAPTGMGTGMMPRRPNETESGLSVNGHLSCKNGSSCGKKSDLIDQRIAFDGLDVLSSVNSLQVSFCGRLWFDKLKFFLQGLHDGFHPPRSRRRILGIMLIKSRMKNNFHRFSLLERSLIHFTISTTEIGQNIAGVLKVLYSGLQGH